MDERTRELLELVKSGTLNRVQEAINAGANVNARGEEGWTALIAAASKNQNPEVITTLLKARKGIEARNDNGVTSLMVAAGSNKKIVVITTLLNAGANGRAKSKEGKTAFEYAQKNDKLKDTDVYWQLEEASQ